MSKHVLDKISRNIRSGDSNFGSNISYQDARECELRGLTYEDLRNTIQRSTINANGGKVTYVSEDIMQSVLEPDSQAKRMCAAWLRKYYLQYTDFDPGKDCSYACAECKQHVYEEYKTSASILLEKRANGIPIVCLRVFYDIWQRNFPKMKLRDSCNICGKCVICMHIADGRSKSGNSDIMKSAFRDAKLCHRVLYKGERKCASDRVQHALEHPSDILHITIDIMDSQGYSLPHGGSQYNYSFGVSSVIVGVLIAGVGSRLYRTVDTYHKSSDLIIEIILMEIQAFMRRNKKAPSIIYLDADGGSENANKLLLCILELLVAKGLSDTIIFTRY